MVREISEWRRACRVGRLKYGVDDAWVACTRQRNGNDAFDGLGLEVKTGSRASSSACMLRLITRTRIIEVSGTMSGPVTLGRMIEHRGIKRWCT